MRIRLRRHMFGLLSVVLLGIAVAGAIAIRVSGSPAVNSDVAAIQVSGNSYADYENGKTVAKTFENAPQGIVIGKVGDEPLFLAEFLDHKVSTESSLDYMKSQIVAGSWSAEAIQDYMDLIENAGISNVALATLIVNLATGQLALVQGYGATEDEVAEHIATLRAFAKQGSISSSLSAYIHRIGQDRYLNEILPITVARQLAIDNMFSSTTDGLSYESATKYRSSFQLEAVEQTQIQIFLGDLIAPANVQDALAYLEAYSTLDRGTRNLHTSNNAKNRSAP